MYGPLKIVYQIYHSKQENQKRKSKVFYVRITTIYCCLLIYESMKRKLLKPIYECRCTGRLQTKRFTRLPQFCASLLKILKKGYLQQNNSMGPPERAPHISAKSHQRKYNGRRVRLDRIKRSAASCDAAYADSDWCGICACHHRARWRGPCRLFPGRFLLGQCRSYQTAGHHKSRELGRVGYRKRERETR